MGGGRHHPYRFLKNEVKGRDGMTKEVRVMNRVRQNEPCPAVNHSSLTSNSRLTLLSSTKKRENNMISLWPLPMVAL